LSNSIFFSQLSSISSRHSTSDNNLINSNFILLFPLADAQQEQQTDESESKIEDNTGGEKKDGSDEDGSGVDDNDNNDENPTDLVDSVEEPTDDVLESFAPVDSIAPPIDPFKTELIDPTNNSESGGSTGGSTNGGNNNNSSIL
jgi:hypothetical protein